MSSPSSPGFLQGGGEMGALMRTFDWSTTDVGPPDVWPQTLRTMVRVALSTNHPIFIFWGPRLTCLYNDAYRQTMGPEYHPGSLGQPGRKVWAEIWPIIGPQLDRVMAGEGATWYEEHLVPVTRHGRREDVYWTYSYSPIEDGERIAGVLVICNDVTRQRRMREALREREEMLSLAQTAGGIGAFTIDIKTNQIAATEEFCRIFGLPVMAQIPASTIENMVIAEDQDRVSHADTREAGSAAPMTDYRIVRPDGDLRWISRRAAYLRDATGRPQQLIGVVQDVTERVRAEEQLKTLNENLEREIEKRTRQLDDVWRNSRDLLTVMGADGRLQAVNPAWSSILGFEPHEVVGRPFYEFVLADDVAATRQSLIDVRQDVHVGFENRLRHRDGTHRWISWIAAPSVEGVIYANGRHVTEIKEQAEALRAAEEALRQAQKMEAVGQLTGGIAHDFNNLLQGIVGSLHMIQKRVQQNRAEGLDRFIMGALDSASRAAALTHRLLAFSRRQPLDPKPVQIEPLILGMQALLRDTLSEQIRLELVFDTGLWPVLCDANQLESAILNLAINARDAMPQGGLLNIEVRNLEAGHVETSRLKPGRYVAIRVVDTGIGMTAETAARAFDPFFTTKPIGQGSGLGLSMIYGFARQSEGNVEITTETGLGTTVTLYLPRYTGALVDVPANPVEAGEQASREGETVLVVEDETIVRSLVVEVLRDLGYRALEAPDGRAGLELLAAQPQVDLLITDVGLPRMNGRQVAEAGRRLKPNLKVLLITGYSHSASSGDDVLEPGVMLMTKPFSMEALAARIRQILQS